MVCPLNYRHTQFQGPLKSSIGTFGNRYPNGHQWNFLTAWKRQNLTNKKQKEVIEVIEDALLLYLESMHREKGAKKKKGRFPF